MLKKVVNTGLASSLVFVLAACGKDKSSDEKVPTRTNVSLAEISGQWESATGQLPLVESYETERGVKIRVEFTHAYSFSSDTFNSQVNCTYTVSDETKTFETVATANVTPTSTGFKVETGAGKITTEIVGGEIVVCETEIMAGSYTVQKSGEFILLQAPGEDAERLLKPVRKI